MSLAQARQRADPAELEAALQSVPALHLERRSRARSWSFRARLRGEAGELRQPLSEHMATWMRAHVAVSSVIKATPTRSR